MGSSGWLLLGVWIQAAYSFSWFTLGWLMVIGKVVYESADSFQSHFTNWAWMLITVFYTLDMLSYMVGGNRNELRQVVCTFGFWITFGSSWIVFWLVFLMFGDNTIMLTKLWIEFGGLYQLGFLLNMNTIFHVLPAISTSTYLMLNMDNITYYNMKLLSDKNPLPPKVIYIVGCILSPLLFIGLYDLFLDTVQIYELSMNRWLLVITAIGVALFYNGTTLLWIKVYDVRRRKQLSSIKKTSIL